MKALNNKKFRYGSAAVGFTVAVIAVIIVINAIVSALANKYVWFFNMTEEDEVLGVSSEAAALVDKIDGSENKITIYFMTDDERLSSSAAGVRASGILQGMKYVYEIAKKYEHAYDFIDIEYVRLFQGSYNVISPGSDVQQEALIKIQDIYGASYDSEYKDMVDNSKFAASTVIIRNDTYMRGSDGKFLLDSTTGEKISEYSVKTLSLSDFYTFKSSSTVEGFCGDYRFATAVSGMCLENSVAYFLTGHGENIGEQDDKEDYGSAQYLADLLSESGFRLEKLNLVNSDFAAVSGADKTRIAVIYNPRIDFTKAEKSDASGEIEKLEGFLSNPDNNVMVFLDQQGSTLKNFNGFLDSHGFTVENVKLNDSGANSIANNGYTISGVYEKSSDEVSLIGNTAQKAVFDNCRPIVIDASKGAYPVISVPSSSSPDGTVSYGNDSTVAMLASSRQNGKGMVTVCGTTGFVSYEMLYNTVYGNRDVMLSVITEMGREATPLNVGMKSLDKNRLDITKNQAIVCTVLLSVTIPLIAVVIGTVVNIRRKFS